MLPDHILQTILFVELAKDVSISVGTVWKERDGWKTKEASLGKYVMETNATSSAIAMVLEDLTQILSRTTHRKAEIVTKSKSTLIAIQSQSRWEVWTITDAKRLAKPVEEAGGVLAIT
jgi:molybdopterin synthase catalytic subunit